MNLERAQEVKNSVLWTEIEKEISQLIEAEISTLRRCKPEDLVRVQARIETFEFIRNLPQVVIDRES